MTNLQRKIIHIDMDCFYAAVEIRDNPSLATKAVAVGGSASQRGVLCTCNYIARSFGIHSAMATSNALRLCPELVLLPVNMAKYKAVSQQIQAIFKQFTELVEPLSLDEAYLDVTNSHQHSGSATLIAEAIRHEIWQKHQLTASAGVANNKFLAKIASGWNKPNGIYVIRPEENLNFIAGLTVNKLFGVGKVTANKLAALNIKTCTDLQGYSLAELSIKFGKLGMQLYYQARGIDNRSVEPNRLRKNLSVENTFVQDLTQYNQAVTEIDKLYSSLTLRQANTANEVPIKNQFIKIKFNDFKLVTAEIQSTSLNLEQFIYLFRTLYAKNPKPIRLLGLGVSFKERPAISSQLTLF
jgi:DNA polymerase-4